MQKIFFLSDNALGKVIYLKLNEMFKKNIVFVNNIPQFANENSNIIDLEEIGFDDKSEFWIANANYYQLEKWCYLAKKTGVNSVRIFKSEIIEDLDTYESICAVSYVANINEKALISKIEYHVCDHCNLNCSGCSHFAPLFEEHFSDLDAFENEMILLQNKFANIFRFRLMGGEPFLNPQLDQFVICARKYFPNTHLEIVTNGLILTRVEEKVWRAIKENDAVLNISMYPPTFNVKERIGSFLNNLEIPYSFGSGLEQYNEDGIIEEFHKNLTLYKDNDEWEATRQCMGSYCHYYRDGKLSKCALPQLIYKLNDKFGTKYEVVENDVIDLKTNIKPWDIVKRMREPIEFCKYCSDSGTERFEWKVDPKGEKISYYILERE